MFTTGFPPPAVPYVSFLPPEYAAVLVVMYITGVPARTAPGARYKTEKAITGGAQKLLGVEIPRVLYPTKRRFQKYRPRRNAGALGGRHNLQPP